MNEHEERPSSEGGFLINNPNDDDPYTRTNFELRPTMTLRLDQTNPFP
jgi:hypothetical protein